MGSKGAGSGEVRGRDKEGVSCMQVQSLHVLYTSAAFSQRGN